MIFSILTPTEKTRLALITLSQFLVSILELIALAATGAVVSLAIRSNDGTGPGDRVQFLLSIINLDNMPAIKLVFIFSVIALLLFTIRTLVSIWFVKHALRFSGAVAARMSAQLSDHYISDLSGKRNLQFNQQEIAYAVTGGSVRLISGTLGTLNMLVADGFLLLIVSGGLLVIDPFSTLIMFFYFCLLTERLNRFANYRESFAKSQAYIQFLPTISKYVLEIALIFGISVISLVQVLNFDVARSFPTLALFIIAASRLAPGIFRLQHNYASFLGAFESTRTTQLILRDLIKTSPNVKKIDLVTNPEASPANYRVDTIANKLQERGIQVSIRTEIWIFLFQI